MVLVTAVHSNGLGLENGVMRADQDLCDIGESLVDEILQGQVCPNLGICINEHI